jgi:hypothetical protein
MLKFETAYDRASTWSMGKASIVLSAPTEQVPACGLWSRIVITPKAQAFLVNNRSVGGVSRPDSEAKRFD